MKNFNTLFLTTLGLGLLASQAARAQQSVGNGATPARPGTMLDVSGPLATAETAVAATGTTAPTATIAAATGQARLTTGTATAGPITVSYGAAANAGQRLVIYNSTALAATFNSQDIPAGQAVEFVYSNSGWRASAGGSNSVAATNGLTKTGNTIGLGGTLTGATAINQNGNNFGLTNGNVGIGTTNPFARLEISGGAREDGSGADVAMSFSGAPSTGLSPLRHYIRTRHTAGLGSGLGGNSIDFYLNNSGNSPSASSGPGVGNIHAVTFDNNNGESRVGIGTTQPTQTLDVVGNARIRGLSAGGVVTADANGNLGLASGAAIDATTASNGLSKNGTDVQLGGALTRPTAVSGISAANPLNFVGTSAAEAVVTVGNATGQGGRVSLGNANHGVMRDLTGSGGGGNDVALYTSNGGGVSRLFLANNPNATGSTGLPLGQFTLLRNGYVGLRAYASNLRSSRSVIFAGAG